MSAGHRIREFIGYKKKAKGRHGVHSPFVYAFIESVLAPSHPPPKGEGSQREGEYLNNLSRRVMSFVREYFPDDRSIEIMLLDSRQPEQWMDTYLELVKSGKEGQVIVVSLPHNTRQQSAFWEELCARPEVTLSLDIYRAGLLFFRKEFKEKQHFVLKH